MIVARNVSVLVTALALGLAACGGSNGEAPPANSLDANPPTQGVMPPSDVPPAGGAGAQGQEAGGGAQTGAALTSEQILGITSAVDSGELTRAQLAQTRAKDSKVKKYAERLANEHLDHKNKHAELAQKLHIAPAETPTSQKLTENATRLAEALKARQGADFDRAYLETETREHLSTLDQLDTKLIPSAQNPDLRSALQDYRSKIESHLKEGQDLLKDLSAQK
jgi:putative membrane protein